MPKGEEGKECTLKKLNAIRTPVAVHHHYIVVQRAEMVVQIEYSVVQPKKQGLHALQSLIIFFKSIFGFPMSLQLKLTSQLQYLTCTFLRLSTDLVRVAPDCNRSYCEDSFSGYSGSV